MGIKFVVKQTPTPPEPEWVAVFDDTYWQVQANGSWDGSKWVQSGPGMVLVYKTGTFWRNGFRPTKVRVTGAVQFASTLKLLDALSGGVTIGQGTTAASVEFDLDFSGAEDMYRFDLYGYLNVTNIEFLGGTLGGGS